MPATNGQRVTKAPVYSEIGATGLIFSGGHVYEEFLTQLQGIRALRIYREMSENDPIIVASLLAIELLIRQVTWDTEPVTEIPIEKSLLFRTTSARGNPEGRSALRGAFTSWYYLKRIREYEAIGIERDLAGMPTFGVPLEVLLGANGEAQAANTAIK